MTASSSRTESPRLALEIEFLDGTRAGVMWPRRHDSHLSYRRNGDTVALTIAAEVKLFTDVAWVDDLRGFKH